MVAPLRLSRMVPPCHAATLQLAAVIAFVISISIGLAHSHEESDEHATEAACSICLSLAGKDIVPGTLGGTTVQHPSPAGPPTPIGHDLLGGRPIRLNAAPRGPPATPLTL